MTTLRVSVSFMAALTFFSVAAPAHATSPAAPPVVFDFTSDKLRADTLYSSERGFGLEPGFAPGGDQPFLFSVKLPEGNYRITVTLGDHHAASDTTVKAELRRLMLESIRTAPGEF